MRVESAHNPRQWYRVTNVKAIGVPVSVVHIRREDSASLRSGTAHICNLHVHGEVEVRAENDGHVVPWHVEAARDVAPQKLRHTHLRVQLAEGVADIERPGAVVVKRLAREARANAIYLSINLGLEHFMVRVEPRHCYA